jgi:hypothetical protein
VGSDSTSRHTLKKTTAASGVSDLTHDMVGTTDNSHFSRTFGSSNDIPAGVDNGHSGLWYEALEEGVWIDRKVGIGINDPLYLLMSSEMLMQATKYHKSANRNYILCQSPDYLDRI